MGHHSYYSRNPYDRLPPAQQQLTPYEQRLRDEVIYLHSLWHQGPPPIRHPPPPPPPSRAHFPFPNNNPYHPTYYLNYPPTRALHVVSPRIFKRKSKKKKKRPMKDIVQDPGPEWPVNSPVRSSPGWPAFESKLERFVPVSEEVMAGIASKAMQKKVVESCRRFFFGNRVGCFDPVLGEGVESGKGDEEEEEELDEEEEEEEEEEGSSDEEREEEVSEEYKFLLGLFVENQELREFYEKNLESGSLYCLVCGGIGVKVWKSFKGCVSLVQHSIAISKTKRRRAHRAYGRVVCEVLGWDFDRLPAIVSKGDPLGRTLANLSQTQVENGDENVEGSKGICGSVDGSDDNGVGGEASGDAKNNSEVGVSENHVRDLGDYQLNEDLAVGTSSAAESGKLVNNEELSKEDADKTIDNVDNQVLPAGANKVGGPDCVDNGVNKQ